MAYSHYQSYEATNIPNQEPSPSEQHVPNSLGPWKNPGEYYNFFSNIVYDDQKQQPQTGDKTHDNQKTTLPTKNEADSTDLPAINSLPSSSGTERDFINLTPMNLAGNQQYLANNAQQYLANNAQQYLANNAQQYLANNAQQYFPNNTQQYFPNNAQQYFPNNAQQYFPNNAQQYFPNNAQQYFPNNAQQYFPNNAEQYFPNNAQQYLPNNTQQYLTNNAQQYLTNNAQQYLQNNAHQEEPIEEPLVPKHLLSYVDRATAEVQEEKPKHKCQFCERVFEKLCYLTQHTNAQHNAEKLFKCPTCGKRFVSQQRLSVHEEKHGSDKPYKCKLCPKKYNFRADLKRHMFVHNEKTNPYICPHCGKGFSRKDHFQNHCFSHEKKAALYNMKRNI